MKQYDSRAGFYHLKELLKKNEWFDSSNIKESIKKGKKYYESEVK